MAYVGNQPARGQFRKLTDISGSFNGVTTTFTTSVPPGTSEFYVTAGSASQLIVSLGGVIQQPDTDYTVSTNSITFTTAPAAGLSFFGVLLGDALNSATPSDGTITTAKLAGNLSAGFAGGSASTPSIYFTGDPNTGIYSPGADTVAISTNGSHRLRVDSSGNVGIGTTSPQQNLVIYNGSSDSSYTQYVNNTTGAAGSNGLLVGIASDETGLVWMQDNSPLRFGTNNNERARIDTSGRLLVGTSTAQGNNQLQIHANNVDGGGAVFLRLGLDATAINGAGYFLGTLNFGNQQGGVGASIRGESDAAWSGTGSTDNPGRLVFSTTSDGASSPTERGRIQADGAFRWTGGNGTPATTTGYSTTGCGFESSGFHGFVRSSFPPGFFNRLTNDGSIVDFAQDTVIEGSISVSGTTISYNGAHLSRWSQIPGIDPYDKDQRPEILRGTVMSNLDEMCDWVCPTSGDCQDNEQLNKTKVSDVEGDKNVAGVFQSWDDDDDTWVNDYYLAMTGDFVIRIAAGVTVERGDLLMSAGDGTAKPQDDDIVRSKTVAKVTSTTVSCTHPDGSYCVPCVLMAC